MSLSTATMKRWSLGRRVYIHVLILGGDISDKCICTFVRPLCPMAQRAYSTRVELARPLMPFSRRADFERLRLALGAVLEPDPTLPGGMSEVARPGISVPTSRRDVTCCIGCWCESIRDKK